MNTPKPLDITTICNGAIPEVFTELLEELLANITDPSTNSETVRSIILKLDFKPSQDRHGAVTTLVSRVKLAPLQNVETGVLFARTDGKLNAYSTHPNQIGMFEPEKPAEEGKKVYPLRS